VAERIRAARNRTLTLTEAERSHYQSQLLQLTGPVSADAILNHTICQDLFQVLNWLPEQFVDLLVIDPPYNLTKQFNQQWVKQRSLEEYSDWVDSWLSRLVRILKPTASVYLCGDWQSSLALYAIASRYFTVRNRITWEREKGRGAKANWKNCAEDIWFCTVSKDYYFDAAAVQLKRQVRAPYTDSTGQPKDWQNTAEGNFRLTAASNLWTDMTVPFWSMPENTDHPTQKPEKLIAKIILASSPVGAVVLDPFLGSGTTSVVAKKLGRQFVGIELDEHYACLAAKRLALAASDRHIQGYCDRVFWERNSLPHQRTLLKRRLLSQP
jgi:site-specific DNA-methyltransferase (adenine-specific)